MWIKGCIKSGALLSVFALLIFSTTLASAVASTPGPGWSLTAVAEPTNFNSSDTQDRVEQVAVSATGGTFELQPAHIGEATSAIAWDASSAAMQRALEGLPEVGVGNVSVSGGPGDATGSKPYTVTWIGALSGGSPGNFLLRENKLTSGGAEGTVAFQQLVQSKALDRYALTAVNVGARASEGELTIVDKLPPQLVAVSMEVEEPSSSGSGTRGACSIATLKCTYSEPVPAGHELLVTLTVAIPGVAVTGPLASEATISGGGARAVSTTEMTPVNVGQAPFGIGGFSFEANGVDGASATQAGSHPYGVTTRIDLTTQLAEANIFGKAFGVTQQIRNVAVSLPLGFVGNPLATERCPEIELTDEEGQLGSGHYRTKCPPGSQVGLIRLVWNGGERSQPNGFPVYNVVPERGYPAELGFNAGLSQPIFLYARVMPSPSGYRLRIATPGALRQQERYIEELSLTVFGDPAEHDAIPGSAAFVRSPADCSGGPLSASAEVSSWEGGFASAESTAYPDLTGCDQLQGAAAFDPSIEVQPQTTQADTPSGYQVDVKLPQAPDVFGALATADLKNATVTLPAGVSVSPSAASGPHALEGCTEAQIDLLGTELGEGHPGGNGSPYDDGLTHASPGHCPEGSQLGEVELRTPLLEEALHGHVYLAEPRCGGAEQPPCTEAAAEKGEVFGLYLEMAGSGVILKLAGTVEAGGYGAHSRDSGLAPGQLRTRFDDNPQLPFEDLKLTFTGGQRAALDNPPTCGTFTTTSELEPWSAPESGPNATPWWSFAVTGCADPMPFSPGFAAGTLTPLAGSYSPFTLQLTRQDGEQDFAGVSVITPPGLEGTLAKVAQCGEPQASLGTCSSVSQIGTVAVASGAGAQPLWLSGPVYLTGPYRGAPFGLSIVVPAKAGPFNLGSVVVRSTISVNPNTAQLTVASDPLPQSVDGVPFRLKAIDVEVDRPGFIFNPTNCESRSISGRITAAQGASAARSMPFAVTGCKGLPFKPAFTASTQGKTSKANGASLSVKVTQRSGEANIQRVDLQLPKALPLRLETLHKACTETQFDTNPAGCPAGSAIGTAAAVTPVLNVPLSGPAYLVSHGSSAFPDVMFVLQGQGVTIVLDGVTDIKKGITYSRFQTVPDAPISSFETSLPEGPHSVFASNLPANADGSFCGQNLVIPMMIEGQNGARIDRTTRVSIAGCKGTIEVVKKRRSGGAVVLTLRSTLAGTLMVSGRGLQQTRRALTAGEHRVKVALTKAGRHRRQIRLKVVLKSGRGTLSKTVTL